jgi:acetyl esterase/lipase
MAHLKLLSISLFLCLSQTTMAQPMDFDEPLPGYQVTVDYRQVADSVLQADLFFPKGIPPGGAWPVVLYVHGGGWSGGNRQAATNWRHHHVHRLLLESGIAVLAIDYRKGEASQMVADPISDCLGALQWIAAFSGKHRLDPDRIAIWGTSAGAHLALMTVVEINQNRPPATPKPDRIAAWYPPTQLTWMLQDDPSQTRKRTKALGFNPRRSKKLASTYSPVDQAKYIDLPTLLIHGEADTLVFPRHSDALHFKLQRNSRPSSLITVKNGVHGFISEPGRGGIVPDMETIQQQTAFFLAEIAN